MTRNQIKRKKRGNGCAVPLWSCVPWTRNSNSSGYGRARRTSAEVHEAENGWRRFVVWR